MNPQEMTARPASSRTATEEKRTQTQTDPTDFERLLKREVKSVSYVPFGADNVIGLNVGIVQKLIAVKTKSGATCSEEDAVKFIAMCQAQRLNPFAGDAYLVGYDKFEKATQTTRPVFSLITAHQALLKRAEASQSYEGMESGIIILNEDQTTTVREADFRLPGENVVGGWAKVYRKDRKPTYRALAIAQRKPNYETPFWSDDKAPEQIVKCAEADALRATFPTLIGGLYTEAEMFIVPQSKNDQAAEIAKSPSSRLVLVKNEQTEPAAQEPAAEQTPAVAPAEQPAPADTQSEKSKLAAVITGAGFTFSDFQKWAVESGNVPDADSLAGFEDLKESDAKRLLRAKTGLLQGLKVGRGQA